MLTFSKSVLAALALTMACAISANGQTTLQWDQITDHLLTEDSVNLSEQAAFNLGIPNFFSDKTGLIPTREGGVIRTDDGGATWTTIYNDMDQQSTHFFLGDYYLLNASTWFTFPSQIGTMWGRTRDAGKHWELFKNPTCPWITPFFLSADLGWGVSEPSICATKDGGKTWSVVAQRPDGLGGLRTIFMLDNTHGWVGAGRSILVTTDGSQWVAQPFDSSLSATEIHFFDQNHGFARAFGRPGGKDMETIFYSTDGGQHWDRTNWNSPDVAGSSSLLGNCVTRGGQDIWVIRGGASVFHSSDGGVSFRVVGSLPSGVTLPASLAVAKQQGKPVLLLLDSNGTLWRALLPAN